MPSGRALDFRRERLGIRRPPQIRLAARGPSRERERIGVEDHALRSIELPGVLQQRCEREAILAPLGASREAARLAARILHQARLEQNPHAREPQRIERGAPRTGGNLCGWSCGRIRLRALRVPLRLLPVISEAPVARERSELRWAARVATAGECAGLPVARAQRLDRIGGVARERSQPARGLAKTPLEVRPPGEPPARFDAQLRPPRLRERRAVALARGRDVVVLVKRACQEQRACAPIVRLLAELLERGLGLVDAAAARERARVPETVLAGAAERGKGGLGLAVTAVAK